jgi:hypothetical protein
MEEGEFLTRELSAGIAVESCNNDRFENKVPSTVFTN